jgi:ribosomal subunit interface protein
MKLHIATEGFGLTPEIREIVDKKFSPKLQKFFKRYPQDTISIRLLIKKRPRWGFRVKADLDIPGENIHAEEVHKELAYAIVALAKEVARRLQKQKEKALNK